MMKRLEIIVISLLMSGLFACGGDATPGDKDKDNASAGNLLDVTATCSGEKKSSRCDATAGSFTGWSRAGVATKLEIPKETTYEGHSNKLGGLLQAASGAGVKVNEEVKDAIDSGELRLVLEFEGWKGDNEPAASFPLYLWDATAGSAEGKVKVKGTSVQKGTFPKAVLVNSKLEKSGDSYKLTAGPVDVTVPIAVLGINTTVTVKEGTIEGTVKKDGSGVAFEDLLLYGKALMSEVPGAIKAAVDNCKCLHGSGLACTPTNCSPACTKLQKACNSLPFLTGTTGDSLFKSEQTAVIILSGKGVTLEGVHE